MGFWFLLLAGCAPGGDDQPPADAAPPTADAAAACGEAPPANPSPPATPPYAGTVFIDPDLMTAADPTSFVGVVYKGQGQRTMYDRRTESFNMSFFLHSDSCSHMSSSVTARVQIRPAHHHVSAWTVHPAGRSSACLTRARGIATYLSTS